MDFIEARITAEKLAKDQRCPAFRKQLCALCERTVLTVAIHVCFPERDSSPTQHRSVRGRSTDIGLAWLACSRQCLRIAWGECRHTALARRVSASRHCLEKGGDDHASRNSHVS